MRSISKVFVAAAVAGACGYASAANLTLETAAFTGGNAIARESAGVSSLTATTGLGVVDLESETAQWAENDQLMFSISGATFGTTTAQDQAFSCENAAGGASTVFSLVGSETTGGTSYLVYEAAAPVGGTSNLSCNIDSVVVLASSLSSAGNVSLSVQTRKVSGSILYTDTATVASVRDAYTISSNSVFDSIIDVQDNRLSFTADDGAADAGMGSNADYFALSLNRDTGFTMVTAATGSMVITLNAGSNFNFLIDPAGSTCEANEGAGQATATGGGIGSTIAINTTCNVMSVTVNTIAAGVYAVSMGRDVAPTSVNSTPFAEQSYTASAVATLSANRSTTVTRSAASAGSWTINGTTVTIPYVPRNANIDLVINISNLSTQSGLITYTAYAPDGTSCTGTFVDPVVANGNRSIGGELRAALLGGNAACNTGGWVGATRASVVLTIPTPATSTEVNSTFSLTDGKSRQLTINTTN